MSQNPIFNVADLAPEVHQRLADEDSPIKAVFEVRQSMRGGGFPADLLTIDCHKSQKRILCVFHDQMPGVLLKEEGLFLGGSSGINVAGAIKLAKELGPGHTIVTILCDSGQRYQSKIWNPSFLKSKDLVVPHWL